MAGKRFGESGVFRLVGLIIMTGWLGSGVATHFWPYLHLPNGAIALGLISGVFQIAFLGWIGIFVWRWQRGDYREELKKQSSRANPPSTRFSIFFWIGVALLLVFAFNIIPDLVKDSHVAGLIMNIGPLVLLVAVWIGFWLKMRRDKGADEQ